MIVYSDSDMVGYFQVLIGMKSVITWCRTMYFLQLEQCRMILSPIAMACVNMIELHPGQVILADRIG